MGEGREGREGRTDALALARRSGCSSLDLILFKDGAIEFKCGMLACLPPAGS